jgi:peroxiredoxin
MQKFNEFIAEVYKSKNKWKKSKEVSKKNLKLINLKKFTAEIEWTSGKYTIVKVGGTLSYKYYIMINDGKVRPSGHGKGPQTYSKLNMAKFYFEEL